MPTPLLASTALLTRVRVLIAIVARSPRSAAFVGGVVAMAGLFELTSTAASEGSPVLGTFVVVAAALLAASAARLIVLLFAVEGARRYIPRRVPGTADTR